MKSLKTFLCLAGIGILSLSCSHTSHPLADPLVSHIDSTVNPGDDFFSFANGKWFKQHPIPASEQDNGIWQLIQNTINTQIRNVCISASKAARLQKGSNKQKIGNFFFSGMDSMRLNQQGLTDLDPEFMRIDAIENSKGLAAEVARIQMISGSPVFSFWIGQDDKLSSRNAIFLWQGGLSLPDRSYYTGMDNHLKTIREKFADYGKQMFTLMGYSSMQAESAASELMKLETNLAKVSRKREDTRDAHKNYHKLTLHQLIKLCPTFQWNLFFNGVGLSGVDSVIVGQPEFFASLNKYLTTYPLPVWKDYLKFHLLLGLSSYLDDKTYLASFNFYGKVLRGIKEPKPRWKRVVENTNDALGDLVGQVYVKEYLPKGTKKKLLEIGNAIRSVYAERIRNLDWMSATTKQKALHKLNAIIMKVGYPDKWKDMSSLHVNRQSYVINEINANKWAFRYMISKYGKPVDRTEWDMEPQTYNAYYNPSNNEIVVPGCNIIIPGYERKMADDAILYAVIGGSTFGHEITHGFDDQGSKFDAKGNLHNWWLPADSARFYAKTRMIVHQFNQYITVDSLHINGEMTQGENIADLGGVVMGYEAFKKTKQFRENKKIGGYTPAQRYFLGFALAWMVDERPEAIANQVRSDVHAPARFRVNGPLSNMPGFYAAFHVHKGQAMWRPDSLRVRIW